MVVAGAPRVCWLVKIAAALARRRRVRSPPRSAGSPPSGSTEARRSGIGSSLGAFGLEGRHTALCIRSAKKITTIISRMITRTRSIENCMAVSLAEADELPLTTFLKSFQPRGQVGDVAQRLELVLGHPGNRSG